MKTRTNIDAIDRALDTLAAAGVSFTVVATCPTTGCEACASTTVCAAA